MAPACSDVRPMSQGLPGYPNLDAAVGTSVPVVTTLLGAISTASFLAPLDADFNSADMIPGSVDWGSGDSALTLGVLAAAAFIMSTLSMVYSHAKNFDLLSPERQRDLLQEAGVVALEDQETHKRDFRESARSWYEWGQFYWLTGVALLSLTVGSLAYDYVRGLASALAVSALAVSLLLMPAVPKPWATASRYALAGASVALFSTTFVS